MWRVYIIENAEHNYYIGYSGKLLEQRVAEHNGGKNKWTKSRGPWKLIYFEEYTDKAEAIKREKQIKSYKGGKAFKALVE